MLKKNTSHRQCRLKTIWFDIEFIYSPVVWVYPAVLPRRSDIRDRILGCCLCSYYACGTGFAQIDTLDLHTLDGYVAFYRAYN